jgi:hypothetical protein
MVIGIAAFALSGAVSSAAVVFRARAAVNEAGAGAAADSAAARDSVHAHAADSASRPAPDVHEDTTAGSHDSVTASQAAPPPAHAAPVIPPPAQTPPPVTPVNARAGLAADGRLAKLFAAMPAKDAARVLDQMSDADIVAILSGMTDKRAGEILALLPPTRSAAVTRLALGTAKDPS